MKERTYPDDTPEFDRSTVSLDFPDELFNTAFQTLTNVSKVASRFIMNSARRYANFIFLFKPVFGDALVVKGLEDATTTTAPTRALTRDTENLNQI